METGPLELWSKSKTMHIDTLLGQQLIQHRKAGLTLTEISERTGISRSVCFAYLKAQGIEAPPKRPGCENCKTRPYALGYCVKCYRRYRRLNGKDQ